MLKRASFARSVIGRVESPGTLCSLWPLAEPAITLLQEAYVRKVIDTVNDLDNVVYEISNESHADSVEWQYHMIDFVHRYEVGKAFQHPVLMTHVFPGGTYEMLDRSPAEGISPGKSAGWSVCSC